jgi:predicted nucleic acid-binding Zn ribbon protein
MASRTFECPICGEDVPLKAKACPNCGACDKTGWNKDADTSGGLDLPDEDFDYDKFVEEEFGEPRKRKGKEFFWWIVALILLIVISALTFYGMLFGS